MDMVRSRISLPPAERGREAALRGIAQEPPDTLGRGATKLRGEAFVQLVLGRVMRATIRAVQVVLRKLGRGSRAVVGRLVRAPRKGSVIVIEFSDGMHEYVTTPVKRVLRLAGREVFYIETVNSRYRLEVRGREVALDGAMGS